MAEIECTSKRGNKLRTFSKRLSTRVDLTPMVDLGFLLITFFVFTTTMAQPTTLDLIEPNDNSSSAVAESGAMTIILGDSNRIYYYHGLLQAPAQIVQTDFKNIRSLILHKKVSTDMMKLMYIIKSNQGSSFGDNINLLDEMAICDIPKGHYAEAELTDFEISMVDVGRK